MKIKNLFKKCIDLGQKAFSLVELLVAVGIGTIVSAGVATLFVFAIEQFTVLVEQNAAEESLLWAAYNTRSFFSQAVNLDVANTVSTNIPLTSPGNIISSYTNTNDGSFATIAVFGREMGRDINGSSLFSTGVFFINPKNTGVGTNSQPWGGTLIFDMGNSGGGTVSPDLGDIWFDRISEFRIQDVECSTTTGTGSACDGRNAKSATFVIKARYFRNAKKEQWNFATNPTGTVAPYRDIEMTVKVGFRDNVLLDAGSSQVGGTADERLHGGLYFYRMVLPPLNM